MHWLAFLGDLWPDDQQAIDTLQEEFGLFLSGDTRHQKAFLIVGPPRSGKGTIARIASHLLGVDNVVGPTLSGLAQNFGLAPLIGKRLAVISDARLGSRVDPQVIAERLLAITGEDALTIDRKFRQAWTGRLRVRFLILSNELPRLADTSGALAGRFIILRLVHSFVGREDLGLLDRLVAELPGILNWAIEGWQRLHSRGHFVQPTSSADTAQQFEDLGSPIKVFLRERCELAPGKQVAVDGLFDAWCAWCQSQKRDSPGNKQSFGRDLHAALPWLEEPDQITVAGKRVRFYEGVGLRQPE